jgi:hypothetical protein
MAAIRNFEVRTNAEQFCVEFCNFVVPLCKVYLIIIKFDTDVFKFMLTT